VAVRFTQKEASKLIDMLKRAVEKEINLPSGKGRVEFDVSGDRREDVFAVNISRKGINATGASYQGRVRTSGTILMRLESIQRRYTRILTGKRSLGRIFMFIRKDTTWLTQFHLILKTKTFIRFAFFSLSVLT